MFRKFAELWDTLQCPELCRLICEHIGSDEKGTLLQLSLSCKTFLEPALDVLWYKLDNFAPLVLCMPGDLYREDMTWEENLELVHTEERGSLVSNGRDSSTSGRVRDKSQILIL